MAGGQSVPIIVLGLIVAQLLCSHCAENQVHLTDGKLFLIGGATKDSSYEIYEALRESTGKPVPNIAVVISGAGSLKVGLEAYYDPLETSMSYQQLFTQYGFEPSVVLLAIDNYAVGSSSLTDLGRENIAKIRNADVVFFNGGDQSRHTRAWLNDDGSDSDIMQVLRTQFVNNGTVIAGTSAGTAVQCDPLFGTGTSYGYYYYNVDLKECQVGEELVDDRDGNNSFRYDENGAYMKGFGFITNSLTDSHFDARGRFARLAVAMQQLQKSFGFGVDEDTGLYIHNGVASVVGNSGVWILDSSSAEYLEEYYFSIEGVKIHYLTSGDSFNLETKELTTFKPAIVPENVEMYESEDIFGFNEGLKSIQDLVNSPIFTTNIGHSYEEDPIARVVFRKELDTQAYVSGDKYAIASLLMDINTYRNQNNTKNKSKKLK